ncbi:MAG: hypothetical protein K6F77_03785, partial [Lachnospiraceae bacterium]|nr:hypothetical protein [Lachnospiraceae bacterium]
MALYKELGILSADNDFVTNLSSFIDLLKLEKADDFKSRLSEFTALKNKVTELYTPNDGDYTILFDNEVNELQEGFRNALRLANELNTEFVKKLSGNNGNEPANDLPQLSEENKEAILAWGEKFRADIFRDNGVIGRLNSKDDLGLPLAVYKIEEEIRLGQYNTVSVKEPPFNEFVRVFKDAELWKNQSNLPSNDDFLDEINENIPDENAVREKKERDLIEYINYDPNKLLEDYIDKIKKNPHIYEYQKTKIPSEILNSGNVEKITEYIDKAKSDDELSIVDEIHLRSRIEATEKIKSINEEANLKMQNNEASLVVAPNYKVNTENSVELDIAQDAFQSSGNGCWSCAASMILKSQGKNISQEIIRAYRPDLGKDGKLDANVANEYANDTEHNLIEMGDALISFAPGTMLHEHTILAYDKDIVKNDTREEYIKNSTAQIKEQIFGALKNDHSAVGMLVGNHYVTVVGMDGDNIKYKDSRIGSGENPDETHIKNLSQFIYNEYYGGANGANISIVWMGQVKLSKDGNSIYGIPNDDAFIDNENGLHKPPKSNDEIMYHDFRDFNKDGSKINRFNWDYKGGNKPIAKGQVLTRDSAYVPHNLNMEYLKAVAANRSEEDEKRLQEIDKNFYKINNENRIKLKAENLAEKNRPANENVVVEEINTDVEEDFERAESTIRKHGKKSNVTSDFEKNDYGTTQAESRTIEKLAGTMLGKTPEELKGEIKLSKNTILKVINPRINPIQNENETQKGTAKKETTKKGNQAKKETTKSKEHDDFNVGMSMDRKLKLFNRISKGLKASLRAKNKKNEPKNVRLDENIGVNPENLRPKGAGKNIPGNINAEGEGNVKFGEEELEKERENLDVGGEFVNDENLDEENIDEEEIHQEVNLGKGYQRTEEELFDDSDDAQMDPEDIDINSIGAFGEDEEEEALEEEQVVEEPQAQAPPVQNPQAAQAQAQAPVEQAQPQAQVEEPQAQVPPVQQVVENPQAAQAQAQAPVEQA